VKFKISKAMKKNVLIAVLLITTLTSFAFAYIQKIEADNQREKAIVAQQMAEMQQQEAEKQRKMSQEAKMVAELQRVIAEEALANCTRTKK
jgi:uncharacterized ion transporter superfamily protein YfcC